MTPRSRRIDGTTSRSAAALLWIVLAVVARIPTTAAVTATNALFAVVLPLTYLAAVGAAVHTSSAPRRAFLAAAAVTLGLTGRWVSWRRRPPPGSCTGNPP